MIELEKKEVQKQRDAVTVNELREELPLRLPHKWEPLAYVDASPDDGYVLRILKAHLANCLARWEGTNMELVKTMNEAQEKREQLLKGAIKKLG
jgi:hypothetical protein